MATCGITNEEMNFARLSKVLLTVCSELMRNILADNVPSPYTDIHEALARVNIQLHQCLTEEQQNLIGTGALTISEFDITLLYSLIRNFSTVPAPITRWGKPTNDTPKRDKSVGANVERLRTLRNGIFGHSATGRVTDEEFKKIWELIVRCIRDLEFHLNLTGYSAQMTAIATQSYEPEVMAELKTTIAYLNKNIQVVHEIKETLRGQTSVLEDLQNRMSEMNTPTEPQSRKVHTTIYDRSATDSNFAETGHLERRLVLIGLAGTGKSSTGNTLLGKDAFVECEPPAEGTAECQLETTTRYRRYLKIIDTPGLFDSEMEENVLYTELCKCMALSHPGPHAFLFVCRGDVRVLTVQLAAFEKFREIFGEGVSKYTTIVITHIESDEKLNKYLAKVPPKFQTLIRKCGGRVIGVNNVCSRQEHKDKFVKAILASVEEVLSANNNTLFKNEIVGVVDYLKNKIEQNVAHPSSKPGFKFEIYTDKEGNRQIVINISKEYVEEAKSFLNAIGTVGFTEKVKEEFGKSILKLLVELLRLIIQKIGNFFEKEKPTDG